GRPGAERQEGHGQAHAGHQGRARGGHRREARVEARRGGLGRMSELSLSFEVELTRRDLHRGFLRTIALYGAGARLLPIVVVLALLVAVDAAVTLAAGRPLEEHHLGFGA